ncbi:MAG TPA: flagellar hook-length control protein FliK, partial [Azospira sp.]|nr:flagellar hook-length control protein FliK [Azospira sp.]
GEQAQPALLNANQPIAAKPPTQAAELVPLLKQAIAQSGMFYEAHQSRWVNQALPLETLLLQPQGQQSAARATSNALPAGTVVADADPAAPGQAPSGPAVGGSAPASSTEQAARPLATSAQPVAPELMPLVQQQLEALATQTYVWQGQAWPGQAMQWEIVEENGGGKQGQEQEEAPWQTRLTLTMPVLGEVRAALRFVAGEVTLAISAASADAAVQLANGGESLRKQLEAAGLALGGFTVGKHERPAE